MVVSFAEYRQAWPPTRAAPNAQSQVLDDSRLVDENTFCCGPCYAAGTATVTVLSRPGAVGRNRMFGGWGGQSRVKRQSEVLTYLPGGTSQATVRRHYLRWREEQTPRLPYRCDNVDCHFHTNPLIWNGKELTLILDHIHGNNSDNRARSLRLLCPNCDSQLPTRGGANKGRVEKAPGGFAIKDPNGRREFSLFADRAGIEEPTGTTDAACEPMGINLTECEFDNPVVVAGGTLLVDGHSYQVPGRVSHVIGSENVKMKLFAENR